MSLTTTNATSAPTLPKKTITIRSFKPTDRPMVVELFSAGMLLYLTTGNHSDEVVKDWHEFIAKSISDDLADIEGTYFGTGGHFWVATCIEENGEEVIAGMVGLKGLPDMAYEVRRLSVRAEYRRYGVGKQLMDHLEQWARAQRVKMIWLSTATIAVHAHKFYHSIGYKLRTIEKYREFPLFEVLIFERELA